MRDIVTASYNHTSKSGTLNNPDYKSYKDFLEHYSDAKNCKDEVESVSSNDSGISSIKLLESKSNNTSTSSLNSEVNGGTAVFSKVEEPSHSAFIGSNRTGSFRNYLDNYNNKKYGSVKPVLPLKPNATTKKSELVIQVNEPINLEVKKGVTSPTIVMLQRPLVSSQVHKPQSIPPPPPPFQELPQQTVLQLTNNTSVTLPPPIPPPFPQIQQTFSPPPPPPIAGLLDANQTKKWATVETENCQTKNDQPKIPKGNMAAANLAKILNEHVLSRRKVSDTEAPCAVSTGETCVKPNENQKASTLPRQLHRTAIPEVSSPKFQNTLQKRVEQSPKAPPSLPKVQRSVSPKAPTCVDTVDYSTVTVVPVIDGSITSEAPSKFYNSSQKRQEASQVPPKGGTLPRVQRSSSPKTCTDSVDYCTTTVVPVTDGSTTVNKGDANVKKLVYNTYRGFLGAYNNKANDMISTLPRNMVTEDKGVGKLVETITSQCRLDKLNGRINPKLEQE